MEKSNVSIRMILLYFLIPILIILTAFYPSDKSKELANNALLNAEKSQGLPENTEDGKLESKKVNQENDANYNQEKGNSIDLFEKPQEVLPKSAKDSIIPTPINKTAPSGMGRKKEKVYYEPAERPNGYYENNRVRVEKQENEEEAKKMAEIKKLVEDIKTANSPVQQAKAENNDVISLPEMIDPSPSRRGSERFFSANNRSLSTKSVMVDLNTKNVVALAEIMETKRVRENTSIRIKVLETIKFGNTTIQSGSYLTGICNFTGNGDRLSITLNSMVINSNYLAVNGSVLDMDGANGIQIYGMQEQKNKNTVLSHIGQGASSQTTPLYMMGTGGTNVSQQVLGQVIGGVASQTLNAGQALLAQKLSKLYADINAGHKVYISISTKNQ
jgi:Conjugative transposon, TraM